MNRTIFEKTNLSWAVDYDYERSACTCDDWICRCTTIERAWVESVDVRKVIDKLYSKYKKTDSEIDKYCFDRICYAFEIYDKNLYEVETVGGYYGEEVYGVYFENEEKIVNAYNVMLAKDTDIEKIQYCLKREYGYLIDCVKYATSATIIETHPDYIRPPQMEYLRKVSGKVIEVYQNRDLPIAVCVKDGDRYRLIDGYHRFVANNDREKVSIVVLE